MPDTTTTPAATTWPPSGAVDFRALKAVAEETGNIRKALEFLVFLAPMSTDVPTTLIGKDGKITIPTGYWPVGLLDPKGVVLDNKTTDDEIKSAGHALATRKDTLSVASSLKLTVQERYKANLEALIAGQDLSAVKADAKTGEIVFDELTIPRNLDWRFLLLVRDINKATGSDVLHARVWTKTTLSDKPGETWADKGANDVDLTFDVLEDTKLGTPCRRIYGGPGFAEMLPQLGWAD